MTSPTLAHPGAAPEPGLVLAKAALAAAARLGLRNRHLALVIGSSEASVSLHAENHHVAGVPADRIRTIEGLVDVVQYLDAMRGRL